MNKRQVFYVPTAKLQAKTTVFPAELADMLQHQAVRQLCIFQTQDGWLLKVLPSWKHDFLTLVNHNHRKEVRAYASLDRLLSTITKFGPLPPTILLGEPPT